jgi:hypothetical protein
VATEVNSKSQSGPRTVMDPNPDNRLLDAAGTHDVLRPELLDGAASSHDVLSESQSLLGRLVKCRGLRATPKSIRTRRQRGR